MHDTRSGRLVAVACAVLSASSCATREAPDFSGRWSPVNRFAVAPQAIPLAAAPAFRATPFDRTLKALLERWASAAGLRLEYSIRDDFLLHAAVAGIAADDLATALRQLQDAFRAQRVALVIDSGRLVARPLPAMAAAEPSR